MKYLYTPLYRPPSFAALPRGWDLVERPRLVPNNYERRVDLPVSEHPHGVVGFDRKLTEHEKDSYQLQFMGAQ